MVELTDAERKKLTDWAAGRFSGNPKPTPVKLSDATIGKLQRLLTTVLEHIPASDRELKGRIRTFATYVGTLSKSTPVDPERIREGNGLLSGLAMSYAGNIDSHEFRAALLDAIGETAKILRPQEKSRR